MSTSIPAVPDHVAVVVPDHRAASARWRDELGGRWAAVFPDTDDMQGGVLRYVNGAFLELLAPAPHAPEDHFLRRFVDRTGPGIHHVTLQVPDLDTAIAVVTEAGYDVVDRDTSQPLWHEAFLRPRQSGGILLQLGWMRDPFDTWVKESGYDHEAPAAAGASFLGPLLGHPDLDEATRLWALLGADVERAGASLTCRWPGSSFDVVVERSDTAGPVSLRFSGTPSLPDDGIHGARVDAA